MLLPIIEISVYDWRAYGGKLLERYVTNRLFKHQYGFWKNENGVGIKVELGKCYNSRVQYVDAIYSTEFRRDRIFV